VIQEIVSKVGVEVDDIRSFACHQANIHILEDIARRINVDFAKFHICLHKYGNTAGASVLIALDEVVCSGSAGPGDLVALVGFGGGLSWGANLIRL
jgi:3-oxoacyl-[acyl-carrier-protein] synthase-3